jgi:ABC-type multidrug transport system permease subunit
LVVLEEVRMMAAQSPLSTAAAPRETAFVLIAAWARRAPRKRLAVWAIGGAVDAVAIALVAPGLWLLGTPLLSIAAVGAWGLAAQRLRDLDAAAVATPRARRALTIAGIVAVVVGTAAAAAAFYGMLWMVFGTRWGPSGG